MRYRSIVNRLQDIYRRLKDPGISLEMVDYLTGTVQKLTEEIRGLAEGVIWRVRVSDPKTGQQGYVYLANLDISEVPDFTRDILRLEYMDCERIPIGKLIIN